MLDQNLTANRATEQMKTAVAFNDEIIHLMKSTTRSALDDMWLDSITGGYFEVRLGFWSGRERVFCVV